MGYLEAILGILAGFFKAIPIVNRWFTKSTTEKVIKKQASTAKEVEDARKSGRPNWK